MTIYLLVYLIGALISFIVSIWQLVVVDRTLNIINIVRSIIWTLGSWPMVVSFIVISIIALDQKYGDDL